MTIEEAFKHYRAHGFPHHRLSPHTLVSAQRLTFRPRRASNTWSSQ